MRISMRRVMALFKKEIKDFSKNPNVLAMCLLPIMFAFIYSLIPEQEFGKNNLLMLVLGMNLVVVSSPVMAILIAEEKEKNTMRTLMLSAVSPMEFLAGKALVILTVSMVNNLIIYYVIGFTSQYLLIYLLLSMLVVITMIVIGAITGLLVQNQMATGVLAMPVSLIFMIVPIFAPINEILAKMAGWLPNYNLQLMLERILNGGPVDWISKSMLVILVWIVATSGTFVYAYNKRGLDG